jgi:hypothetical protein
MNQTKLMSFSDNPDGIGKEKLDPRKQVGKVLIIDLDKRFSGKRAPRGRANKTLARRFGATEAREHRWGRKAVNPCEVAR